MKIKWTLRNMDGLLNRHLKANAEYWKSDLLYNARKILEKMRNSYGLKILSKGSEQLKNMMFLLESKAEFAVDDINNLVDYEVKVVSDDMTEFILFVNDAYFQEHDALKQIAGKTARRYLIRKKVSRQELIDNFQNEIRNLYTNDIMGEVLEDDGHNLRVW